MFRARQVLFEGRATAAGDNGGAPDNSSLAAVQPAVEVGAAASESEGAATGDDLPF